MIEITGDIERREDNDELYSAEDIKEKIIDSWPDIESSKQDRVKLVVSPQFDYGPVRETDILLIADFDKPKNIALPFITEPIGRAEATKNIIIQNLMVVIEVKKISQEKLRVDDNNLFFQYYGQRHPKNITKQNTNQAFSCKKQIQHDPLYRTKALPFILNFIYLSEGKVDKNKFSQKVYNIYGIDLNWHWVVQDLALSLRRFSKNNYREKNPTYQSFHKKDREYFYKAGYFPQHEFTILDQKQMDRISSKIPDKWKWKETIGQKLLILKGVGGTGKTIRLLQLAHNIFEEKNERVLILTYNRALIANLRRLMFLKGIGSMNEHGGNIQFLSVMQFMYMLLKSYDFLIEDSFLSSYESQIKELADHLREGSLTQKEIKMQTDQLLNEEFSDEKIFDYTFIDEGQDWLKDEAFIISQIFGAKNIAVAHGINQEVRGQSYDWGRLVPNQDKRIAKLSKGRRMKSNLISFIKVFSENEILNDSYQRLEKIKEAPGGKIYITVGDYFLKDKNAFDNFLKEQLIGAGANIDLLHCVNNQDVVKTIEQGDEEKKYSLIAEKIKNFGYEVWDANGYHTRKTIPKSTDSIRFLNYESSRGLEGWSVFLYNFDIFWEDKINEASKEYEKISTQEDLFQNQLQSKEEWCKDFAAKWALIALTRGISSVVIHINKKDSYIGKKLYEIYSKNTDYIYWLED